MTASFVSPHRRIALSRAAALAVFALLSVSLNGWSLAAPFIEHSLSLVGWVLIGLGVLGRLWCGSHIGGQKNAVLTMVGPYSVCRNPLYFFSFVGGLGVMLVTETLLLPLAFAVVFLAYYAKVISAEEETLLGIHGAVFTAYCSRVPRFWPQFSLHVEPERYLVSAKHFATSRSEALWFIVAGGIVEFIEGLHISGFLPVFVYIY